MAKVKNIGQLLDEVSLIPLTRYEAQVFLAWAASGPKFHPSVGYFSSKLKIQAPNVSRALAGLITKKILVCMYGNTLGRKRYALHPDLAGRIGEETEIPYEQELELAGKGDMEHSAREVRRQIKC